MARLGQNGSGGLRARRETLGERLEETRGYVEPKSMTYYPDSGGIRFLSTFRGTEHVADSVQQCLAQKLQARGRRVQADSVRPCRSARPS